jgi:hypothetical protein
MLTDSLVNKYLPAATFHILSSTGVSERLAVRKNGTIAVGLWRVRQAPAYRQTKL